MSARRVEPQALTRLIDQSGLSKAELSRRSGVSLSHIKNACGAKFRLGARTAAAIATALGCDPDDFLTSDPTPNAEPAVTAPRDAA
jgi:transcriptional regulator with XRE-family HTH domain